MREAMDAQGEKAPLVTKQEILHEIADAVGGLDIALRRMNEQGLREDLRDTLGKLAQLVHAESARPIWVSGYGVLGERDERVP